MINYLHFVFKDNLNSKSFKLFWNSLKKDRKRGRKREREKDIKRERERERERKILREKDRKRDRDKETGNGR